MTKLQNLKILALGACATSLIACGPPDDGEKNGEPLDHVAARQAVTANTQLASQRLSDAIAFIETAPILERSIDYGATYEVCEPVPVGAPEGTQPTCYEETDAVDLDLDLSDDGDLLAQEIEARILTEENIESQTSSQITYLLQGSVVCAEDGATPDPECVADVDDMEIRLVLSSPSPGDIDVDLQVGPDKANPVSLQLHDDLIGVEVDLGGVDAAAAHLESVSGESYDLPDTFEGRAGARMQILGPQSVEVSLSVIQAIKISDGEWSLAVAAADPLSRVSVDGAAQTLETELAVGTIDGTFPAWSYEYDEVTGTETETRYDAGFHLAGLTGLAKLSAGLDAVVMTGLGLGPDTSTATVNGNHVAAVDLNPNAGRTLDATLAVGADDSISLKLSPELDLTVMLQFAAAADVLGEFDEWMLDDVLNIKFDGAAEPTVRTHADGLEVVDGQLSMSLANAGISHTVAAGQCLMQPADVLVEGDGSTEEPVDPEPATWTPLDDFEAGACE